MSRCKRCKGKECVGVCTWCETHIRPKDLGSERDGFMLCKKCQSDPKVPSGIK